MSLTPRTILKMKEPLSSNGAKNFNLLLSILMTFISLLFGQLSLGINEALWYMDLYGGLIIFPLYFFQNLFFLNAAIKTDKTKFFQLYLWGILYGLFESFMTQTIWVGFGNYNTIFNIPRVLGIAPIEFLTLILFWHPLLSFVLPILFFEYLAIMANQKRTNPLPLAEVIFPSHIKFFEKQKKSTAFLLLFLVISNLVGSFNYFDKYYNDLSLPIISISATYALIIGCYTIIVRVHESFTIYRMRLKKRRFLLSILPIATFYTVFFIIQGIKRNRVSIPSLIFTIGFYFTICLLLKISKPITNTTPHIPRKVQLKVPSWNIFLFVFFLQCFFIFIGFLINILYPNIAFVSFIIELLIISIWGLILLISAIISAFK